MQSMQDIKRRIKSVENTQKITRAMKMVAAAKLKRAQERAEGAKTFFQSTKSIFENVSNAVLDVTHPLLIDRGGKKVGYILITSDRGLAGGFSIKMSKEIEAHIEDKSNTSLLAIGRKGRDHFKRRDYNIVSEYIGIEDEPNFDTAQKIAQEIIQLYEDEVLDKVYLGFMSFKSALTQVPKIVPLLPVVPEEGENRKIDYIYEPDPKEVLDWVLPKFVENIIYSALLESKASEFGSRMTAMDSATENAEEMIDDLTLSFNRARQAEITTEITEIVGGAEALK